MFIYVKEIIIWGINLIIIPSSRKTKIITSICNIILLFNYSCLTIYLSSDIYNIQYGPTMYTLINKIHKVGFNSFQFCSE